MPVPDSYGSRRYGGRDESSSYSPFSPARSVTRPGYISSNYTSKLTIPSTLPPRPSYERKLSTDSSSSGRYSSIGTRTIPITYGSTILNRSSVSPIRAATTSYKRDGPTVSERIKNFDTSSSGEKEFCSRFLRSRDSSLSNSVKSRGSYGITSTRDRSGSREFGTSQLLGTSVNIGPRERERDVKGNIITRAASIGPSAVSSRSRNGFSHQGSTEVTSKSNVTSESSSANVSRGTTPPRTNNAKDTNKSAETEVDSFTPMSETSVTSSKLKTKSNNADITMLVNPTSDFSHPGLNPKVSVSSSVVCDASNGDKDLNTVKKSMNGNQNLEEGRSKGQSVNNVSTINHDSNGNDIHTPSVLGDIGHNSEPELLQRKVEVNGCRIPKLDSKLSKPSVHSKIIFHKIGLEASEGKENVDLTVAYEKNGLSLNSELNWLDNSNQISSERNQCKEEDETSVKSTKTCQESNLDSGTEEFQSKFYATQNSNEDILTRSLLPYEDSTSHKSNEPISEPIDSSSINSKRTQSSRSKSKSKSPTPVVTLTIPKPPPLPQKSSDLESDVTSEMSGSNSSKYGCSSGSCSKENDDSGVYAYRPVAGGHSYSDSSDNESDIYNSSPTLGGRFRSSKEKRESENISGLNGLRNIGNTCFMNSVIQCLSNTKPLLDYISKKGYLGDVNTTTSSMKGTLIKAFADVIHELWRDSRSVVDTSSFKDQIQRYAPRFMGYSQQDAQEFLRYLLEGLHEDINRVTTKPKPILTEIDDSWSDTQKANESWKRYLRNDDSKIVDLFVGQLKSTLKCTVCGHCSVTFDPFWDLSLPIPSKGSQVRLTHCLELFTKEEVLDGDEKPTCAKCATRRKCTKSFSIQKFPKILVIHLKRFSPTERYRGKLSTSVDFPLHGLDMTHYAANRSQSCIYNLYGVANHSGSTYSGHYIAYCKHPRNNEWYNYNDSRVSPISSQSVVSSEGYVLFYELSNSSL